MLNSSELPFGICCSLLWVALIVTSILQYVFAIAAGTGFEAGGELYRSDYYGSHESWKNITGALPGDESSPEIPEMMLRAPAVCQRSQKNPCQPYFHFIPYVLQDSWTSTITASAFYGEQLQYIQVGKTQRRF